MVLAVLLGAVQVTAWGLLGAVQVTAWGLLAVALTAVTAWLLLVRFGDHHRTRRAGSRRGPARRGRRRW